MNRSAGILMYRSRDGKLEVFLVHPGGPFFERKDEGSWSIPKGEIDEGEEPLDAAKREFREETGFSAEGQLLPLTPVLQRADKEVHAWAVEGDLDASSLQSTTFQLEWPPRSGMVRDFPEIDRGGWFDLPAARRKILKGQIPLLDELERLLGGDACS